MAKAAWTRKEGKNPEGGLNQKGRDSYNKETGGNLKAPSKVVGNKRRASFCARMRGMKKKRPVYQKESMAPMSSALVPRSSRPTGPL